MTRQLELGDLGSLLQLYTQLHPDDLPLAIDSRVAALWQKLVASPDHIYMGAFVGSRLVSACNAAVIDNLTRGGRPYALIENVVTHAAHRRQGYASRVLQALLAQCWARGCYKVMLMSSAKRTEAHTFYVALGFNPNAKHAFVINAPERS